MKCVYCGAEIGLDEKFCPKCGKEVQVVPSYNVLDDDLHVMVSKGGAENEEESTTCVKGNGLKPEKKSNTRLIISIIIAIAVVAIGLSLLAYFNTKKKEQSYEYQYNKAQEYEKANLNEKAVECYKLAIDIKPESTEANMALAYLYEIENEESKAINIYTNIIDYDPSAIESYKRLLGLYRASGNTDAIVGLMTRITDDDVMALFEDYKVSSPIFEQDPGKYSDDVSLTISYDANARVLYTTDGTNPSENGKMYTGKIPLAEGKTTVRALCINGYDIESDEIEGTYEITYANPTEPSASIDSGQYELPQEITLTIPIDCMVYYTWDGTDPTVDSEHYMGSFEMNEGNNILSIIAIDSKGMASDVVRYNYIAIKPDSSKKVQP